MDFFANPIVAVLLLLGVLVIVHETGHFLVGRLCGIAVEIYSVGFGPVLLNWRRGETQYRLSAIPLGGFVKFYGSVPSEEVPENLHGREFHRAATWKRACVVLAGPLANFLLAIFAYAGMVMYGIPQPPPVVGEVMKGSPAEKAGLRFGDKVVVINGSSIATWSELQRKITASPGAAIDVTIERQGERMPLHIVPASVADEDLMGIKQKGQIGISPGFVPAIVSVLPGNTIASTAGFQTGDEITKMTGGSQGEQAIKYWRPLQKLMFDEYQKGTKELVFEVKRPTAVKDNKETLSLRLPLDALAPGISSPAALSEHLGLTHSQFTIEAIREPQFLTGLKRGDRVIRFNGQELSDIFQFRDLLVANQEPQAKLTIQRGLEVKEITVPLQAIEVQKPEGKATAYAFPTEFMGAFVESELVIEQHRNPIAALSYGVHETWAKTSMVATAVWGLITGKMPLQSLGGPISIAKVASDSVKLGWMTFFGTMAIVSINLGLLNLLPIPVLDGGQLVLVGAEAIKRRPLTQSAIENYQKIGFVLVLALIVMATYNDVSRFWASMVRSVTGNP